MKWLAVLLGLLIFASTASAQSVQQSGSVTPTHYACWTTTGILQDCGTSLQPFATTGGVVGPFCVLSAPPTSSGYQSFCLSSTTGGGAVLSTQNFGTASPLGISFNINGTAASIPVVSGATVANDFACFLNTTGTLVDCGNTFGNIALANNKVFIGNGSNIATGQTISGDCTTTNTGAITCTKTNGAAFVASATTDTTSASNISSGTLGAARLPGGLNTVTGAVKNNGSGTYTQAACADLSNGATGCSTATGTSGATLPLNNGNNTFSGNNTYSGTSTFTGSAFFGSGSPWADVKSFGAVGNNSNDDTTAIRNAISQVSTNGGMVYFPPGQYKITGTLTVPSGVVLVGPNLTAAQIFATSADFTAISFSTNGAASGLFGLSVFCIQSTTASTQCVVVNTNAKVFMRDSRIWGGNTAITTSGVDGYYENLDVSGWATANYSIVSTAGGANWYIRVKIDNASGGNLAGGFLQGTASAIAENHFVQSDFSSSSPGGSYTNAIVVSDSNSNSITVFSDCVFAYPIDVGPSKATMFLGDEFGSTSFTTNGGPVAISGSFAFSATTVTGTSTRSCGANISITC